MNWKIVNNFELERYVHHGGLSWKRKREIKKMLQWDTQLRKEVEKLKRSNQNFKNKFPADIMVPQIVERFRDQVPLKENKFTEPSKWSRRWFVIGPVLTVALLLLIFIIPNFNIFKPADSGQDIILKGNQNIDFSQPQLIIHRKMNSEIEVLENGAIGRAGDLLQLAYIAADQAYGVIFSIDGNGKVSLHYPQAAGQPTSLNGDKFYLPEAIELDNAPKFERFFFITSNSKIDVAYMMQVAEELAADPERAKREKLRLPRDYKQVSLNINKEQSQ